MSKIKVSEEVATALDTAMKVMDKEKFFEEHSNKFGWTLDIYLPLNQISNWEMAQILINGYEVEETPEDRILKLYNLAIGSEPFDRGYRMAVRHVLDELNVKIKEINH